jgi:hypothetical protein
MQPRRTLKQVQQLVQLVRMRHCTPYYAGTIMPHSGIVQKGIERSALPLMRECCTPDGFDMLEKVCCSALQTYPAWSAAPRPESEQQPVLEWRLPMDTLKTAVEQLVSSGRMAGVGVSAQSIVQGQPMQIVAEMADALNDAGTDTALHLGLYLRLLELPAGAVRIVHEKFSIIALGGGAHLSKLGKQGMSSEKPCRGFANFLCLGTERSWQTVKAELKREGLVHGVGSAGAASQGQMQSSYLHIKVHVSTLN